MALRLSRVTLPTASLSSCAGAAACARIAAADTAATARSIRPARPRLGDFMITLGSSHLGHVVQADRARDIIGRIDQPAEVERVGGEPGDADPANVTHVGNRVGWLQIAEKAPS